MMGRRRRCAYSRTNALRRFSFPPEASASLRRSSHLGPSFSLICLSSFDSSASALASLEVNSHWKDLPREPVTSSMPDSSVILLKKAAALRA